MKRFVTVIWCFLLSSIMLGQSLLHTEFLQYMSDYENFNFEELKQHKFQNALEDKDLPKHWHRYFGEIVIRNLDFNVVESKYTIRIPFAEEDGFLKQLSYKIHCLKKESQVIAVICHDEYQNKEIIYSNDNEMSTYIAQHDSLYQTSTTIDNLIDDLVTNYIYGYLCGNAPILRDVPERNGLKFNDYANVYTFRQWMRSYSPENQSYGADAISYLYKNKPKFSIGEKNIEIRELDIKLAEYIKARNSRINTCSGCLIGIYRKVY